MWILQSVLSVFCILCLTVGTLDLHIPEKSGTFVLILVAGGLLYTALPAIGILRNTKNHTILHYE